MLSHTNDMKVRVKLNLSLFRNNFCNAAQDGCWVATYCKIVIA